MDVKMKEPQELFEELKKEMVFLPEEDSVRTAFMYAFAYALVF